jgi:hypothetical protein
VPPSIQLYLHITCFWALARASRSLADISLVDWGQREIAIAETEMPGLMALRKEFGAARPLTGARIVGCLHMTIALDPPTQPRRIGGLAPVELWSV